MLKPLKDVISRDQVSKDTAISVKTNGLKSVISVQTLPQALAQHFRQSHVF